MFKSWSYRLFKAKFTRSGVSMLDRDLAEMYNVETRVLNQAIKRKMERFPEDFMFQLTDEEFQNWKSQIVTTNSITELAMKQKYAATHRNPIGFIKSKD